jgi:hypothetical protein
MSLPRIVVSEHVSHGLRGVAASDQKSIRPRPRGRTSQRTLAKFPVQRSAGELGIAPAFRYRRDRRLDDAIGDPPTSQFVRHTQPSIASAQQQILGAAPRQRVVVYISEIAKAEKGCVDDRRSEAVAREMRRHLGGCARGAREHPDGGGVRALGRGIAATAPARRAVAGLRNGRS